MKILILGPLNYPDARKDLQILNYTQKIYSSYYLLEGILASSNAPLANVSALMLLLSNSLDKNIYQKYDFFFGLIPKSFHFDKIIVYNSEILSTQEDFLGKEFKDLYHTTDEATDTVANVYEAIKLAQL